jgi:hypothetical protein
MAPKLPLKSSFPKRYKDISLKNLTFLDRYVITQMFQIYRQAQLPTWHDTNTKFRSLNVYEMWTSYRQKYEVKTPALHYITQ